MPLRLHHSDDDFAARFSALVDAERAADADIGGAVAEIVASVRDQGDAALLAYTERFDGHALKAADLRVDAAEIAAARHLAARRLAARGGGDTTLVDDKACGVHGPRAAHRLPDL